MQNLSRNQKELKTTTFLECAQKSLANKQKSALVLGAGMVTGPLVEYLDDHGIKLTLASALKEEAETLIQRCQAKHAVAESIDLRG